MKKSKEKDGKSPGKSLQGKRNAAPKGQEVKKKDGDVLLTERDVQIIRWINSHRAATLQQVAKKFELGYEVVRHRLSRLRSVDYLVYENLFFHKPGVYMAAAKGVALAGDDLPPVRLQLSSYIHDLQLVDLALRLEQETGVFWMTDRQLRREKGLRGIGTTGHCPDGVLIFPDSNDKVAVELELTSKGMERTEKILEEYAKKQYKEVWYFVGRDLPSSIIKTLFLPFIKVFSWPDMKKYANTPESAAAQLHRVLDRTVNESKKSREFFASGSGERAFISRTKEEEDALEVYTEFFHYKGR
jgi:hypothetical protein